MKWEYKIMEVLEWAKVLDLLNELGELEWEFTYCDFDKNVFIFKRPVQTKSKDDKALEGYFGGKVG